jgi:hypothetical protein
MTEGVRNPPSVSRGFRVDDVGCDDVGCILDDVGFKCRFADVGSDKLRARDGVRDLMEISGESFRETSMGLGCARACECVAVLESYSGFSILSVSSNQNELSS